MSRKFTQKFRFEIGQQLKFIREAKGLSPEQVVIDNNTGVMKILQTESEIHYGYRR